MSENLKILIMTEKLVEGLKQLKINSVFFILLKIVSPEQVTFRENPELITERDTKNQEPDIFVSKHAQPYGEWK